MPVLAAGLYLHSFWILVAVIIWTVVNPLVFPKPERVDNWMSRGVLGEQLYFAAGKKLRRDLPTLLNLLNIPVFIGFLYLGYRQELVPMVLAGLLTMTIKFWFIDRMALLATRVGAVTGPADRNAAQGQEKNARLEVIATLLQEKGEITNNDVEALLGVSDATAERYLQEFETSGDIVQVGGTGRSVVYRLKQ
jgi:hypothetical protein